MALSLARKFRTFVDLPAFTICWLLPVWVLLGVYRALILTTPLKRLAPFYGEDAGVFPWVPLINASEVHRARQIRSTIAIVVRYCPWVANCYPQALAAGTLLRIYRVPHAIYFGLARSGEASELNAHAWAVAGPVSVSGGQGFDRYRVVRMFVGSQQARGDTT